MSQWARENPEGPSYLDAHTDLADMREKPDSFGNYDRPDDERVFGFYLDEDGNRLDAATGLPFTERDEQRQLEREQD